MNKYPLFDIEVVFMISSHLKLLKTCDLTWTNISAAKIEAMISSHLKLMISSHLKLLKTCDLTWTKISAEQIDAMISSYLKLMISSHLKLKQKLKT